MIALAPVFNTLSFILPVPLVPLLPVQIKELPVTQDETGILKGLPEQALTGPAVATGTGLIVIDFALRPVTESPQTSIIKGGGILKVGVVPQVVGHPGIVNAIVSDPVLVQPSEELPY